MRKPAASGAFKFRTIPKLNLTVGVHFSPITTVAVFFLSVCGRKAPTAAKLDAQRAIPHLSRKIDDLDSEIRGFFILKSWSVSRVAR